MDNEVLGIKVTEHEGKLQLLGERVSNLEERTEKIEALVISVERLAVSVEHMAKDITELKNDTNTIKSRLTDVEQTPFKDKADFHDKVKSQIITLIVGAIVGFLLQTFFRA